MCIKCLLEGRKCESANHFLHVVRWWKGQGGLDAANLPPLVGDHISDGDDLIDDLDGFGHYGESPRYEEPGDLYDTSPDPARENETGIDSITGLGIRQSISKATA